MNLKSLLDLIFPTYCLGCRKNTKNSELICGGCLAAVTLNTAFFCGKCSARLPNGKKICHKDFPYLLGAAANYSDNAVRSLVHGLKFKYLKSAALALGGLLTKYSETLPAHFKKFMVIPIPLSASRSRKRGFNQSELLAKILSGHFGLQLEINCLLRTGDAKPQSETKNLRERRENVRGCFSIKNPELLRGKNVILVDDVTTSGATLLEAANVLKSAGVKKIIALTVARA